MFMPDKWALNQRRVVRIETDQHKALFTRERLNDGNLK
jgi:hypothetical protein